VGESCFGEPSRDLGDHPFLDPAPDRVPDHSLLGFQEIIELVEVDAAKCLHLMDLRVSGRTAAVGAVRCERYQRVRVRVNGRGRFKEIGAFRRSIGRKGSD
jgi:hypothetical protein